MTKHFCDRCCAQTGKKISVMPYSVHASSESIKRDTLELCDSCWADWLATVKTFIRWKR